jgi:hypothetical protein
MTTSQYPGLRFASKALQVLAILELIAGGFVVWPYTLLGPIPGVLAAAAVVTGGILLWAAAEFCALGVEVAEHIRRGGSPGR